jgi:bifunctional non-homologous end joining protein LigD
MRASVAPSAIPTIDLMHPTLVSKPFHRAGWVYEEKYDGWRMLAYKHGDQVRLVSRAGRDHTRRSPGLVAAIASLSPTTLVLDGEVCVFDERLISRFEWLRARSKDQTATPPIFMAFDCLWVNGHDLRAEGLHVRRDQLEEMVEGQDLLLPARRLADDGLKSWQQVIDCGYEGLVAKDSASPYRAGRTLAWLKVKVANYREGERGWESRLRS